MYDQLQSKPVLRKCIAQRYYECPRARLFRSKQPTTRELFLRGKRVYALPNRTTQLSQTGLRTNHNPSPLSAVGRAPSSLMRCSILAGSQWVPDFSENKGPPYIRKIVVTKTLFSEYKGAPLFSEKSRRHLWGTGGTECTSQRVGKNCRSQQNDKRDVC
jgi:hypothetical protein